MLDDGLFALITDNTSRERVESLSDFQKAEDHRDRHFYTWNMWTDVVQYEDKKNAQYYKPRKRYYAMHIDGKTIKQAQLCYGCRTR